MLDTLINSPGIPGEMKAIAFKVMHGERITSEEGLYLYREAELSALSVLADVVRTRINGDDVYFNRNIHIEPTNICVYNCTFCSYSHHQSKYSWEYSIPEMVEMAVNQSENITEVHIVGAVHPAKDLYYYIELVKAIRQAMPAIHIKAFTAIEIEYMVARAGLTLENGLFMLKQAGLNSIPGGGAEIFDDKIRDVICGKKSTAESWLQVHETAHRLGIPSNATILYGHIEKYEDRISHLQKLRDLQDRTKGFNAFIPLKFRSSNNELSWIGEVPLVEDLRNFAVSRLFLDNIPHLKAYWPMIGMQNALTALSFGADDLDGTINDSTKIYSMAGANDQNPSITTNELRKLILENRRTPVERDSLYNKLHIG